MVDTPGLGPGGSNPMEVQVLSPAQRKPLDVLVEWFFVAKNIRGILIIDLVEIESDIADPFFDAF